MVLRNRQPLIVAPSEFELEIEVKVLGLHLDPLHGKLHTVLLWLEVVEVPPKDSCHSVLLEAEELVAKGLLEASKHSAKRAAIIHLLTGDQSGAYFGAILHLSLQFFSYVLVSNRQRTNLLRKLAEIMNRRHKVFMNLEEGRMQSTPEAEEL